MNRAALLFAALAIFFFSAGTACADVVVSVGYYNNLSGNPGGADPQGVLTSANTTFIGHGLATSTSYDSGLIGFLNTGSSAVTIASVTATGPGGPFSLWNASLPFVLQPGKTLVLGETIFANFDTSDNGLTPKFIITGTVNGAAFSFTDSTGALFGNNAVNSPETTPFTTIGVAAIPEPASITIFGLMAAGGAFYGWRRRKVASAA